MNTVEEMRRLGDELLTGLDLRVNYLKTLRDEVAGLLADYREERTNLARELRADLAQDKAERSAALDKMLADFTRVRREMEAELRQSLAEFQEQLERQVAETLASFTAHREVLVQEKLTRQEEVADLLEGFRQARQELRTILDELHAVWGKITRELSARRGSNNDL